MAKQLSSAYKESGEHSSNFSQLEKLTQTTTTRWMESIVWWSTTSSGNIQHSNIQNGNIWKNHFEKLYEQISPNKLNHKQKQMQEKLTILESTIKK